MDVFDENHICSASPFHSSIPPMVSMCTDMTDHSDPSGLYSYANQPSRILFALDKLHQALAPLIGFEILKSASSSTTSGKELDVELPETLTDESVTAETVQELTEVAMQEMEGWEEGYWKIQREAEARGWRRVSCRCHFLSMFGRKVQRNVQRCSIRRSLLFLSRRREADGLALWPRHYPKDRQPRNISRLSPSAPHIRPRHVKLFPAPGIL